MKIFIFISVIFCISLFAWLKPDNVELQANDNSINKEVTNSHKFNEQYSDENINNIDFSNVVTNSLGQAEIQHQEFLDGRHEMSSWEASIGKSQEIFYTYENYDNKIVKQLAKQGDINALHIHALNLLEEDKQLNSYAMLYHAAARGSTRALNLMGMQASSLLENLENGFLDEDTVRKKFNMPEDTTTFSALSRAIVSPYLVAAIRGDVGDSLLSIQDYQKNMRDGRPFSQEEWHVIKADAMSFYENLSEKRQRIGLQPFDNSYPVAYAYMFSLPRENNDPLSYLEKQLVR